MIHMIQGDIEIKKKIIIKKLMMHQIHQRYLHSYQFFNFFTIYIQNN